MLHQASLNANRQCTQEHLACAAITLGCLNCRHPWRVYYQAVASQLLLNTVLQQHLGCCKKPSGLPWVCLSPACSTSCRQVVAAFIISHGADCQQIFILSGRNSSMCIMGVLWCHAVPFTMLGEVTSMFNCSTSVFQTQSFVSLSYCLPADAAGVASGLVSCAALQRSV